VDQDSRFMQMALKEAERGFGTTSPNPRVGAVIVSDDRVISRGHHRTFGDLHAEAESLRHLPAGRAAGATLYVNLEPCCHYGKTPPCTSVIIQSGIRRVVYGIRDPNPQVDGKGLRHLSEAGIEVHGPLLKEKAREINRGYLKFRRFGRPWVTLKWAQSLDGRIAASTGDARWISCPESLKLAHRLRAEHDAVLIGINTALTDNPLLTVRHTRGHNPCRVILDSNLRFSPNAAMFEEGSAPILIATRPYPPAEKAKHLGARGAELIWLPACENGTLDLGVLLDELGQRGILYLMVEGGSRVLASFINQSLFDEIILVMAPILIGGDGIPSTGALGINKVTQSVKLEVKRRKRYGQDYALWLRPTL